jgi:hypothetical protein
MSILWEKYGILAWHITTSCGHIDKALVTKLNTRESTPFTDFILQSFFFNPLTDIHSNHLWIYRGADKSLARPTSQCILFDGENISFDASLVKIHK